MLIDSFKLIYNKVSNLCLDTVDLIDVNEWKPDATMNHLRIEEPGSMFTVYPADLLKDMPSITSERSSSIKDKDCDGIIFHKKEGIEDLILTELKSGFDTGKICDAFNQIIHSFLKLHIMFSVCKDYQVSQLSVKFIVVCKTYKDEAQEAGVLEKINNAQTLKSGTFEDKFLSRLLANKYVDVIMDEFHDVSINPFNDDIKNKHIQMRLCLTNSYADTSVTTDL